jgi:MFS family permease
MLASNSPAILTGNFPGNQRGRALGLVSMMTYLGLTVGPSLGGWLAEAVSWRAVFYINVPVGALALTLGLVCIPKVESQDSSQKFDLAGAALFLMGLSALLLGLNQGAEWGWSSLPVIGLLLAAVLFMMVFVLVERRSPAPMLDLGLFRVPLF